MRHDRSTGPCRICTGFAVNRELRDYAGPEAGNHGITRPGVVDGVGPAAADHPVAAEARQEGLVGRAAAELVIVEAAVDAFDAPYSIRCAGVGEVRVARKTATGCWVVDPLVAEISIDAVEGEFVTQSVVSAAAVDVSEKPVKLK